MFAGRAPPVGCQVCTCHCKKLCSVALLPFVRSELSSRLRKHRSCRLACHLGSRGCRQVQRALDLLGAVQCAPDPVRLPAVIPRVVGSSHSLEAPLLLGLQPAALQGRRLAMIGQALTGGVTRGEGPDVDELPHAWRASWSDGQDLVGLALARVHTHPCAVTPFTLPHVQHQVWQQGRADDESLRSVRCAHLQNGARRRQALGRRFRAAFVCAHARYCRRRPDTATSELA